MYAGKSRKREGTIDLHFPANVLRPVLSSANKTSIYNGTDMLEESMDLGIKEIKPYHRGYHSKLPHSLGFWNSSTEDESPLYIQTQWLKRHFLVQKL